MTVNTITGLTITHSDLPAEHSPFLIESLPPTSHMSHDGAATVLEDCITYVYEDLIAKHGPTEENPTIINTLYKSLENILKSSLTTQSIATSPDTDPFTHDEMEQYLYTAANKALPTDMEQHEMEAITSKQEMLMLTITTVQYTFQYANYGWDRGTLPLETNNPLPDKHDYISGQLTPATT